MQIINSPDKAALNAGLLRAYERREPWLGYQWGTNGPALLHDLVRLQEPEYTDQCWYTTKACAYQDATILIAANPDLANAAPDVVDFLRAWDFNIDVYKTAVRWRDRNPNADVEATALWWLNNRSHVWGRWVTPEAANNIRSALAAGQIPGGWPR